MRRLGAVAEQCTARAFATLSRRLNLSHSSTRETGATTLPSASASIRIVVLLVVAEDLRPCSMASSP